MRSNFPDIATLLQEADNHKLYENLVKQLSKDFNYANVFINLEPSISPIDLKKIIHETIYKLIQERFADYLNLLYIIDVPEKEIKRLESDNVLLLSEQVSFLILRREWQKVWYRNQY